MPSTTEINGCGGQTVKLTRTVDFALPRGQQRWKTLAETYLSFDDGETVGRAWRRRTLAVWLATGRCSFPFFHEQDELNSGLRDDRSTTMIDDGQSDHGSWWDGEAGYGVWSRPPLCCAVVATWKEGRRRESKSGLARTVILGKRTNVFFASLNYARYLSKNYARRVSVSSLPIWPEMWDFFSRGLIMLGRTSVPIRLGNLRFFSRALTTGGCRLVVGTPVGSHKGRPTDRYWIVASKRCLFLVFLVVRDERRDERLHMWSFKWTELSEALLLASLYWTAGPFRH